MIDHKAGPSGQIKIYLPSPWSLKKLFYMPVTRHYMINKKRLDSSFSRIKKNKDTDCMNVQDNTKEKKWKNLYDFLFFIRTKNKISVYKYKNRWKNIYVCVSFFIVLFACVLVVCCFKISDIFQPYIVFIDRGKDKHITMQLESII